MQKCGNCQFWNAVQGERGECRLNPPQVIVIVDKQQKQGLNGSGILTGGPEVVVNRVQALFPPMGREDKGCGQFQELPKLSGTMYG